MKDVEVNASNRKDYEMKEYTPNTPLQDFIQDATDLLFMFAWLTPALALVIAVGAFFFHMGASV